MPKVHLDTDPGGDIDDNWALAMLLSWEGVGIAEILIVLEERDGWLHDRVHPSGKWIRVVKKIDGPRFNEFWLSKLTNR